MVPIYLAFILKTEKRNSQKNTTPIYIRLIRNRKKAEARLDIEYYLIEAQVSKWNAIYQRLTEKNSIINNYLDELSARFSDHKRTFSFRDPSHSLHEIIAKILAKEKKKRTPIVIPYLDKYYSEEIEFSNFKVKGTKINYKKAINHLKSFLCFQNLSDIEIVNFNTTLAEKFKNYLQSGYPEINKKINSPVSASSNIKRLKPIFDKAVRENLIEKNPFEKMKLVYDSPLTRTIRHKTTFILHKLTSIRINSDKLYPSLNLYQNEI